MQTDKIFAGIILIGLIGLAIDQIFRLLHRKSFPWLYSK
jgi:NitT/TauT family transport system permease protein